MLSTIRGGVYGLGIGALVLLIAYFTAANCLPHIIAQSANAPALCATDTYRAIMRLTFPLNLLTNDVARAANLFWTTLLFYTFLGALLGRVVGRRR